MAEFQAWDKSRNLQPEGGGVKRKSVCHLTAEQFLAHAPMISVDFGGQILKGKPKRFSSGSFGWNVTGKFEAEVGGELLTVQVGANLVVCGSKPE
jgi:hypothetical protein